MDRGNLVRIASEIILGLTVEQKVAGPPWPHPWDHCPFVAGGKCVWLRYTDLDTGQREQIKDALANMQRTLGALGISPELQLYESGGSSVWSAQALCRSENA
jgi:hypothetical protein